MKLGYAQIRNDFEKRITTGDLKPGDRLPPEVELSGRYSTSRATVARALKELEAKGLLRRRRGAGTFVSTLERKPKAIARLAMFTPWAVEGQEIGHFQSHIHAGLSSMCAEHEAELTLQGLSSSGDDYRTRLFRAADQLLKRQTSAVFFCPAELDHEQMGLNGEVVEHLEANGCRVVLVDRDLTPYPDRSKFPWISYDNRRGAALLTRHLVTQGYERIAFVGIPQDSTAVSDRLAGYRDGLTLMGRPYDASLIFTTDAPDLALCRRMLHDVRPDAIIAKDSRFAARIGSLLLSEGFRIGLDVGVAGFDDDPAASVLHVPLTIVRQPIEPFVSAAFQMAMQVLRGENVTGQQLIIPTELFIRDSTSHSSRP